MRIQYPLTALRKYLLVFICAFATTMVNALPAAAHNVLVLGDSLSASYGLRQDQGWVNLLAMRMRQMAPSYRVVNASISGETTAGGASRINALLNTHHPKIVILALGANDGLRGLSIETMHANLANIVRAAQISGAQVLLVGMRVPPNYGMTYSNQFSDVYVKLAQEYQLVLLPFLLQGFAEKRDFFQADQLHPNAAAQTPMLNNVWEKLAPLLREVKRK